MARKKHTQKDKDEVIRVFTTSKENSVEQVSKTTGLLFNFVDKTITEYYKNKFNNKQKL